LIISADHGEAFGEHGTLYHSKSLYDELIHVPLWIRIAGQQGRRIQTPVSLIDMGPTLLDLFGAPTPGYFKGQSLVPLLRGEEPNLTRPIAAETRLRQTLVFPEGIKAIKDQLSGAREVYDLNTDPLELRNIVDHTDRKYQDMLDVFFAVHKNPMYERTAPYRP
jgi:arylsulfatase A-like enzyme